MAEVRFERGLEADVEVEIPTDGHVYVGTDTGNMYLGKGDGTKLPIGQADWQQTDSTKSDYIKNKPAIPDDKEYVAGDNVKIVEYIPLKYVANFIVNIDGTNYYPVVYTGVRARAGQTIELRMYSPAQTANYGYWFIASSSRTYGVYAAVGSRCPIKLGKGSASAPLLSAIKKATATTYSIVATLSADDDGESSLYVKNENTGAEDTVTGVITSPTDIDGIWCIFGNNRGSAQNSYGGTRFLSARVTDADGVLIGDLVPVKRASDGKAGVLNIVDGSFHTNSIYPLTAGPVVEGARRYVVSATGIPTATSDLVNDSGFITADDIPTVTVPEYTVEKLSTAEQGYSSSYVLKKDGTQVGATINIPKDMVVSDGELKTVTAANVPYQGAQVGDKYIDLTVANASQDHIYIPVKDLADVYTAGNGIDISADNVISLSEPVPSASDAAPLMDGTAAAGTSSDYAREDHVHPTDTSRVPTTRTVNGKALSADITLTASDVGALPSDTVIPTVGTLDTDNATAQSVNASESLGGTVKLHKVSKTGSYADLLGKPTIPDINAALYKGVRINSTVSTGEGLLVKTALKANSASYPMFHIIGWHNNSGKLIDTYVTFYNYLDRNSSMYLPSVLHNGRNIGSIHAFVYNPDDPTSPTTGYIYIWIPTVIRYNTYHVYCRLQDSETNHVDTIAKAEMFDETLVARHSVITPYVSAMTNDIPSLPLSIDNGGTGGTTAKAAEYNLTPNLATENASDVSDTVMIPCIHSNASEANGRFVGYRTGLRMWNYIKSKIASVLGIGGSNGIPTAPTAAAGTSTTQIATTAFVGNALSGLATDSDVVHKAGSETIAGYKTFSNGSKFSAIDIGNSNMSIDICCESLGGKPTLVLYDNDDDSDVIVSKVATPTASNHAANKQYVDNKVAGIAHPLEMNKVLLKTPVSYAYSIQGGTLCFVTVNSEIMPLVTVYEGEASVIDEMNEIPIGSTMYYSLNVYAKSDVATKEFWSSMNGCDLSQHGAIATSAFGSTERLFMKVYPSANNGYVRPDEGEPFATDSTIVVGGFYMLLGNVTSNDSTSQTFFLQEENPLYYCSNVVDGVPTLIDWATYISTANGYWFKAFEFIGETSLNLSNHLTFNLTGGDVPPLGCYLITAQFQVKGSIANSVEMVNTRLSYSTDGGINKVMVTASSIAVPAYKNTNGFATVTLQGYVVMSSKPRSFMLYLDMETSMTNASITGAGPVLGTWTGTSSHCSTIFMRKVQEYNVTIN